MVTSPAGPAVGPIVGVLVGTVCGESAIAACEGVQSACYAGCYNIGSGCCPVACGHLCCAGSELCLDPGAGLCCSAGYMGCNGSAVAPVCFDPHQDVCLGSGETCAASANTCGTAGQQVCCPSGMCNGSTCAPASNFGITVSAMTTAEGPVVCGTGVAFTPNGNVSIEYLDVPGEVDGGVIQGSSILRADGSGNITFTEDEFDENNLTCSSGLAGQVVIVQATDVASGHVTSGTVPANFWCFGAMGSIGSGCTVP